MDGIKNNDEVSWAENVEGSRNGDGSRSQEGGMKEVGMEDMDGKVGWNMEEWGEQDEVENDWRYDESRHEKKVGNKDEECRDEEGEE